MDKREIKIGILDLTGGGCIKSLFFTAEALRRREIKH